MKTTPEAAITLFQAAEADLQAELRHESHGEPMSGARGVDLQIRVPFRTLFHKGAVLLLMDKILHYP